MFAAVIASTVWICQSFNWESVSSFLVTLAGYLGSDIYLYKKYVNLDRMKADKKLYELLQKELPYNELISYFKSTDMSNPIDDNFISQLRDFIYYWNNPEHEFHNKSMQKKLRNLLTNTDEFLSSVGLNTYADIPGKQVVPKDWLDKGLEAKYRAAVSDLNSKADIMVNAHEDMFRTAKKKLNV